MFLINDAFAAAATTTPSTTQGIISMLPMIAILVAFMYFMVIRPQSKRAKEHKNLMNNIQKGDEVVTIGGVLGKVDKVTGDFIVINIAENVNITAQKSAIANILPKGTIKSV